jgi:hypothetical protein
VDATLWYLDRVQIVENGGFAINLRQEQQTR